MTSSTRPPSEEEYDAALTNEVRWELEPDGTLARGPRTAWGSDRGAAWRP